MTRKEILEAAEKCICQDRNKQYGEPEDNFTVIAELWSVYLDRYISARDVCLLMALFKIARARAGGSIDSYIDLAGYAACGGELISNAL